MNADTFRRLYLGDWMTNPNESDCRHIEPRNYGRIQRAIEAIPTPLAHRHVILCRSAEQASFVVLRIGAQRADCYVWHGEFPSGERYNPARIPGSDPSKNWVVILDPLDPAARLAK